MTIPPFKSTVYPEFVADQVLTSDNLNNLFKYLDEQGRMTRTQLTGTGIACGFNIVTAADGTSIILTEGAGITSDGYLVVDKKRTYVKKSALPFNALQCEYYDKFVQTASNPYTQKIADLWELMEEDDQRNAEPLDATFLAGKIILLFVEKLEENNKNCDPNSCDEKGTKVTVAIKALVANSAQVDTYLAESKAIQRPLVLPEFKMPGYKTASPAIKTSAEILNRYRSILNRGFIDSVKTLLTDAHLKLRTVLQEDFDAEGVSGHEFDFMLDGIAAIMSGSTISQSRYMHVQYYYDFINDLLLAYDELRTKAFELVCNCVPDNELFPRHLLAGEAIGFNEITSLYRTRFISSGASCCCAEDVMEINFLYRRMVLMAQHVFIRGVGDGDFAVQPGRVSITPSSLGRSFLSERAIPYYYRPATGMKKLYEYWNFKKTMAKAAKKNLSYWAAEYNNVAPIDETVTSPLNYDIEPYNFFRIEAITGKNAASVSKEIKDAIRASGLPFKIVSLATGDPLEGYKNAECCSLADIELQYQVLRRKLLCCLRDNLKFWSSLEEKEDGKGDVVVFIPKDKLKNGNEFEFYFKDVSEAGVKIEIAAKAKEGAGTASKASSRKYQNLEVKYNKYQERIKIKMSGLPAPAVEAAPAENITYYALILIDELNELITLLSEEDIIKFKSVAFVDSVAGLDDAYTHMGPLVSSYNSRQYFIDKIKINTGERHAAEVDKIAAAMSIISESDAMNLITLIANSSPGGGPLEIDITSFIRDMEAARNNYSAQVTLISRYLESKRDALMLIQAEDIKEPEGDYTSNYNSLVDYLSTRKCSCDIAALKFLLQRYKEQQAKLTDMNNFSVYAQHHPGLQHKAGVTAGGTFVLVYKGANDNTAPGIDVNTVIADFYLPYTCCSDCTPLEITIQQPPPPVQQPPVAKPGDNISIQLPLNSVTLDGSTSSDPDGTIETYFWEKTEGADVTIDAANPTTIIASGLVAGVYKFKLTVTDNDGLSNSGMVTVTVIEPANIPPTAVATVDKTNVTLPDGTVTLNGGNSTDPDAGTVLSYVWSLDDGITGAVINAPNQVSTTVTFSQPGLYVFTLTVNDGKGGSDTDKVFVLANRPAPPTNIPPTAVINASQHMVTLNSNNSAGVTLNGAASSDPDDGIKTYKWSMQGGMTGALILSPDDKITDVKFTQAGTYLFTLTVTDYAGMPANTFALITVNQRNIEPAVSSCGELSVMRSDFVRIQENNSGPFIAFKEIYRSNGELKQFYDDASAPEIEAANETAQTDFFVLKKLHTRLVIWLTDLREPMSRFDVTIPMLTMLNIHAQLAFYAACIQAKDVNDSETRVPMRNSLEALISILNLLSQRVPDYAVDQRNVLEKLRSITIGAKDIALASDNNKPEYIIRLDKIIGQLTAMNL